MISDLIAFLNARLDEIERLANQALPWPYGSDPATAWIGIPGPTPLYVWAHMTAHDPAGVLRDVAAKRRLIERYERAVAVPESVSSFVRGQDDGYRQACLDAIQDAIAVYSDHPDYRQEWAMEGSSGAR